MRIAASVALAAVVATGMAGCMLVTPQQTSRSYTPSDGINAQVNGVDIRNVMLVANSAGDAGTLVGAFVNQSSSTKTVTLEYETSGGSTTQQQVSVPADGIVSYGAPSDSTGDAATAPVVLDDIDASLGGLFQVVASSGNDGETLQLPVLNGSLSQYQTLVPSATPTPTPTRSRRATDEPTISPQPTETP